MATLRWISGPPLPFVDNLPVPTGNDFMGPPRARYEPMDAISRYYSRLGRGFGAITSGFEAEVGANIFKSKILGTRQPVIQAKAREALRKWIKGNFDIGVDPADITIDRYSPARGVDVSLYGFVVWDADTATRRKVADKAREIAMMRGTRSLTFQDFVPPGYNPAARGGFLVAFTDGETTFTPELIAQIGRGAAAGNQAYDTARAPHAAPAAHGEETDEEHEPESFDFEPPPPGDVTFTPGSGVEYASYRPAAAIRGARLDAKQMKREARMAGVGGASDAAGAFAASMRSPAVRMQMLAKVSQEGNRVTLGSKSGWENNDQALSDTIKRAHAAAAEHGADLEAERDEEGNLVYVFTEGGQGNPSGRRRLVKLSDLPSGFVARTPGGWLAKTGPQPRYALGHKSRSAGVGMVPLDAIGNLLTGTGNLLSGGGKQQPTPTTSDKVTLPTTRYVKLLTKAERSDEWQRKYDTLQRQYDTLRAMLVKVDPKAAAVLDEPAVAVSGFDTSTDDAYAGLVDDLEDYVAFTGDLDVALGVVGEIIDSLGTAYNFTDPPWLHVVGATDPYAASNTWLGTDPNAQAARGYMKQRERELKSDLKKSRAAQAQAKKEAAKQRRKLNQKLREAERAAAARQREADARHREQLARQRALAEEKRLKVLAEAEERRKADLAAANKEAADKAAALEAERVAAAAAAEAAAAQEAEAAKKPKIEETLVNITKLFGDTLTKIAAQPKAPTTEPYAADEWADHEDADFDAETEALLLEAEAFADPSDTDGTIDW